MGPSGTIWIQMVPSAVDKARTALYRSQMATGPVDPLTRLAELERAVKAALDFLAEEDRTEVSVTHHQPMPVARRRAVAA
jgi:hypothetical protein